MTKDPFERIQVNPYLEGIEAITDNNLPWSLSDIAIARIFHPQLKTSFDTSSFILWERDNRFKVTNKFPREYMAARYLGNSELGVRSVIELMPSDYYGDPGEEFCIVNPQDDPSEEYAISLRDFRSGRQYGREELQKIGGILGDGPTKEQTYRHPVWRALFENNLSDLGKVINWVWDCADWVTKPMGIYLDNPKKLCAHTWKLRGEEAHFNATAIHGFNNKKIFLTQRKS